MPPKRVCTDKKLSGNQIRESSGVCFKKGLRAGFSAGISKGSKVSKNKQSQISAASSAVAMSKFKPISVERASNDLRKVYLAEMKTPNYRNMSAEESINRLRARGITKLYLPRF